MARRFAFSLVAALSVLLSAMATEKLLAQGCGCEAHVCHLHRHCCRGCCQYPPMGMVVPSMPMMSAPVMAAPFMAAPVMVAPVAAMPVAAAPMTTFSVAAAPTLSFAPVQSAPQSTLQFSLAQTPPSAPAAALTQDQQDRLMRALTQAFAPTTNCNSSAAPVSPPAAPADQTLADRVSDLERRVVVLESMAKDTVDVLKKHADTLRTLSGK